MLYGILHKILKWLPSTISLVAIFWFTLATEPTPGIELPTFQGFDKLCHSIMFGELTFCLWFDCKRSGNHKKISILYTLIIVIFCIALGILIEYLQDIMKNGRVFEYADILSNAIGSIIAGVSAIFYDYCVYRFLKM